jgi:uridylate kinase
MRYVISLGGSVIVPKEVDVGFLSRFAKMIKTLGRKHRFAIVCGGGSIARKYGDAALRLGVDEIKSHEIGTQVTLLNAFFMATVLNGGFVPGHPKTTAKKFGKRPIVSGGYKPGWTTDVDAAIIAKEVKANALINVTNVDYVYDSDPMTNPDAEKIEKISWKDFMKLPAMHRRPGAHYVFDPDAAKICMRANIKVYVLGKDVHNLRNCIEGKPFIGTMIF